MGTETSGNTASIAIAEKTNWRVSRRARSQLIAGALLMATATSACATIEQTGSKSITTAHPLPEAGPTLPVTEIPGTTKKIEDTFWPGMKEGEIPYPGGVMLPTSTCTTWDVDHPQPYFLRDGKMLTVIDARQSTKECSPLVDKGAMAYNGASHNATPVLQPEGEAYIPDGTVVTIVAFAVGQRVCNPGGTSDIWASVQRSPIIQEVSWVPSTNLAGVGENAFRAENVPVEQSPFVGTVAKGC